MNNKKDIISTLKNINSFKELKNSVNFKLSDVNLHMTESKKCLLNDFTSDERHKHFP